MVYYYKTADGHLIYVGKDKFENEELIKFCFPDRDIWFHVDKLSSAHVYLRLEEEDEGIDSIDLDVLEDVCQLTKYNSIQGNKQPVTIIYTKCTNLKKDSSMDIGQVTFKSTTKGSVKRYSCNERDNSIINRLNKTKTEQHLDLRQELINHQKVLLKKKKEKEVKYEGKKNFELKQEYNQVFNDERNMYSNKGLDLTKTAAELEEDFM